MSDHLMSAENRIIEQLAATSRGPKRNGLFAIWLLVRACEAELPPIELSNRVRRRRLIDLERRMSSLSMPPQIKKALVGCVRDLSDATPEKAVAVLKLLTAPAKEHLGPAVGDAIGLAARDARGSIRSSIQGAK